MARRPVFERSLASRGHLSPQEPKLPWSYLALAHLSVGYSRLEGRSPTCYSPVRRFTQGVAPLFSRDLHVLGTPPAFVLSQDQTLQLSWRTPSDLSVPGAHETKQKHSPDLARTKQSALSMITSLGTFSALRKVWKRGATI